MRSVVTALLVFSTAAFGYFEPARAATGTPVQLDERASGEIVQRWIYNYRAKPEPAKVPIAVRILTRANAFKDPDSGGIYVGFIAGALGANPSRAEDLVNKMMPMPPEDQWVLVRAIAYSGLPDWKGLMRKLADRIPARRVMIEEYLAGKLPTLTQIAMEEQKPSFGEKMKDVFTFGEKPKVRKPLTFDQSPELLDTLWGYYFASGSYAPILRVISMLPWAKDRDSTDKLTIGSMARYTLATYAVRDNGLREFLKSEVKHQPKEVAVVLNEVIEGADTVQIARLRKDALAAMEELKTKGPGYKRDVSFWGQVGVGAVAAGCLAAGVLGQVEFGLPCVLGGSLSQGALSFWQHQD
ncbi:MAG TPA: hypothetical protein VHN11_14030 [Xanthobacteraceae bacterium]|jgi:hypothetical protein|nr:hypothetical protein [Xanthobacteraceae bacterium]